MDVEDDGCPLPFCNNCGGFSFTQINDPAVRAEFGPLPPHALLWRCDSQQCDRYYAVAEEED